MIAERLETFGQDAEAVTAVRGGDPERYRELVERHERRVFAVAWSRLGDAALAEDAAQEAFIRGYRRLWMLGDGAKFAGWITTLARNAAINLGLKQRRELNKRERWALEQTAAPAAGEEASEVCAPETLRQTLAKLPDAQRECLVLFYLEGRSGAEAAMALGISESAFRVRLHRARAALREQLEEKLAGSLEKLRPAKTLVPAIMAGVLASSSAKAATAGGGGTVILGTLVKVAPFKWLLPFLATSIGALPGLTLTALAGKAEQRNFREPGGFRAQAHRVMYRKILWLVPLIVIPMVLGIQALNSKLGQKRSDWILAVVTVACFAWAWRMLGALSRFQRGMLIWYGILAGGLVLKAAGLIPASAYTYFFIAASLWLAWIIRWRPTRMDNSLFLRAMMGMLEIPSPATSATIPTARLEKSDLERFGKFVADLHLFNAIHWYPDGLLLRQTFTKLPWPADKAAQFKAALPFSARDSSNVLLHWDGDVTAYLSEADQRTQRVLKTEEAALRSKVEAQVAAAVKQAWQEFRGGDTVAAERALGEKADSEIFVVPPARAASTRWLQVLAALPAVLFTAMLLVGRYPQILKPFIGSHLKPVFRSAATINSASQSKTTTPGTTKTNSPETLSVTNTSEATNQPSRLKQP
jgi:RNA polymerase sigma-70 factor (ECF subfamily)